MQRIVNAAWLAAIGKIGVPNQSGLCLQHTRLIIEHAFGWKPQEFYDRYLVRASSRKPEGTNPRLDPWAVDLESSMKHLGLSVPFEDRQPGDLVFNHHGAKPYGHVGILVSRDLFIENINPNYRKKSIILPCFQALTRLEDYPITLVARLPEEVNT